MASARGVRRGGREIRDQGKAPSTTNPGHDGPPLAPVPRSPARGRGPGNRPSRRCPPLDKRLHRARPFPRTDARRLARGDGRLTRPEEQGRAEPDAARLVLTPAGSTAPPSRLLAAAPSAAARAPRSSRAGLAAGLGGARPAPSGTSPQASRDRRDEEGPASRAGRRSREVNRPDSGGV